MTDLDIPALNRWAEVKSFLRIRKVYFRHMLHVSRLSVWGNKTASEFAAGMPDGPRQVLSTFRRIYG